MIIDPRDVAAEKLEPGRVVEHTSEGIDVILTPEEIQENVARIATGLAGCDLPNPLIIGVLQGGKDFAELLHQQMQPLWRNEIELDWIQARSQSGQGSSGTLTMLFEESVDVAGRHLLLADDIIDEAVTMAALYDRYAAMGVASVTPVTLLDRPMNHPEFGLIRGVDYVSCFELNDPRYVFGFGIDDGLGGHREHAFVGAMPSN